MGTDLDIAWMAGIVDGEGTFVTWKTTSSRGKKVNWFKYRLSVAMINQIAVQKCKDISGYGTVSQNRLTSTGKPVWSWKVEAKTAAKVAILLLPYLVVKRNQAELFISLAATMNQYGNTKTPTDETLLYREQLFEQIRNLNY